MPDNTLRQCRWKEQTMRQTLPALDRASHDGYWRFLQALGLVNAAIETKKQHCADANTA
jgi:hypothetical protein